MLPPIRCVAFDAVGTLIYPEPSVSQAYWQIGRRYGTTLTVDEVRTRFHTAFNDLAGGVRNDYSTSEVEERNRWRQIVESVLPDVGNMDRCFEDLYNHFAMPSAWRCFPDVAVALEQLVASGVEVLVASNFDERLNGLCESIPELRPLRRRVISASIGWHKPSVNFYSQLVSVAGHSAEQILMVGDDRENDVTAARQAGLMALLIDRNGVAGGDVITDLRQILQRN